MSMVRVKNSDLEFDLDLDFQDYLILLLTPEMWRAGNFIGYGFNLDAKKI